MRVVRPLYYESRIKHAHYYCVAQRFTLTWRKNAAVFVKASRRFANQPPQDLKLGK